MLHTIMTLKQDATFWQILKSVRESVHQECAWESNTSISW